jgi:hypothetical protein
LCEAERAVGRGGGGGGGGGGGVKEGLALAFVYVGPSEVPEYVLVAVSAARLQHSGPILLVVSLHALPAPNKKQEQESALEAWALQEDVRLFAAGPKHFTCFTSAACPPLRCRSETLYLLYWHKRTNSDGGRAGGGRGAAHLGASRALFAHVAPRYPL